MAEKTVTLSKREYYAQRGINYDKSTRRFLSEHAEADEPTVRMHKSELQALVSESTTEAEP